MPEAVASNSIPMLERHRIRPKGIPPLSERFYFQKLPSHIEENYEAVIEMLKAHGVMVQAVMENGDDFSLYAAGIHNIYRLIVLRLDAVVSDIDILVDGMADRHLLQGKSQSDLLERIGAIVAAAYTESGVAMDMGRQVEWSNETLKIYASTTAMYCRELETKLDGDNHLLDAGSLLPWLEMKIWREIAGVDLTQRRSVSSDASLRDRLIVEHAQAGIPASDLSQAFGIRRSTVERIIGRLTATEDETRKAV